MHLIAQSEILREKCGLLPHAAVLRLTERVAASFRNEHQYIVHTKVWRPDGSISYDSGVYGIPFRGPDMGVHIQTAVEAFNARCRLLGAETETQQIVDLLVDA